MKACFPICAVYEAQGCTSDILIACLPFGLFVCGWDPTKKPAGAAVAAPKTVMKKATEMIKNAEEEATACCGCGEEPPKKGAAPKKKQPTK